MAINVKTNLIPITLNFDNGDTGTFFCNANSSNFFDKVYSFDDKVSEKIKNIDMAEIKINSDGSIVSDDKEIDQTSDRYKEMLKVIIDTENIFKEEVDEVFGKGASDIIFKYSSPLSYSPYFEDFYIIGIMIEIVHELSGVMRKQQKDILKKKNKKNNKKNK